jgi:hypothetical protein
LISERVLAEILLPPGGEVDPLHSFHFFSHLFGDIDIEHDLCRVYQTVMTAEESGEVVDAVAAKVRQTTSGKKRAVEGAVVTPQFRSLEPTPVDVRRVTHPPAVRSPKGDQIHFGAGEVVERPQLPDVQLLVVVAFDVEPLFKSVALAYALASQSKGSRCDSGSPMKYTKKMVQTHESATRFT